VEYTRSMNISQEDTIYNSALNTLHPTPYYHLFPRELLSIQPRLREQRSEFKVPFVV
jgi:hypothetical protein